MKRITFTAVALMAITAIFTATENANAQLLDTLSRVIPQRVIPQIVPRPFQGNQPQQPTCSRPVQPPTYTRPPAYTQPVYTQPVYSQPVYTQPVYTQPVYSQPAPVNPVVVSPTPAKAPSAAEVAKARAKQLGNAAKQQFRNKQYAQAKASLDEIVKLVPNDVSGWQFRSIVSFAMGDFDDAAADAYDTLQLGNTWTRDSIDRLFGDNAAEYETQFSKLKAAVAQKPSMQGHFLLAYHHMVNKQLKESKNELENVLKLAPEEPLSKKLIVAVDQSLAKQ